MAGGLLADEQRCCDAGVRQTPGAQLEDLLLTLGENWPPTGREGRPCPLEVVEEGNGGINGTHDAQLPEHRKGGLCLAVRANAVCNGKEAEFDAALDTFCDTWDRGTDGEARFEREYLLAVGTRL